MSTPVAAPPPLDAAVVALRADRTRTWGAPEVVLALLAAPLSLLAAGLWIALTPVSGAGGAASSLAVASVVLVAVTLLAVRRPARQSGLAPATGFDLPAWGDVGTAVRWSLGLLLAQVLAAAVLGLLVPSLAGVPADNTSFLAGAPPVLLVVVALAAVLVAPVVEELLFRGLVLRGLMLRLGFWPAAGVSSVLFGVLHAPGPGTAALPVVTATGVLGLGLCVLARRTGRLGPGILVHALRNAVAVGGVALTSG